LSVAVALTVLVPETVAPAAGAVIATVGGVSSICALVVTEREPRVTANARRTTPRDEPIPAFMERLLRIAEGSPGLTKTLHRSVTGLFRSRSDRVGFLIGP